MGFDFKKSEAVNNNTTDEHNKKINEDRLYLKIVEAICNPDDNYNVDHALNYLPEDKKKECIKVLFEETNIYSPQREDKTCILGSLYKIVEHFDDPKLYQSIGEDLIKLTANADYHLRKGYISVKEESRCYLDQMHELFRKYKNNSEFNFEWFPEFWYCRLYTYVSIVILRKQIDNPEEIYVPSAVKEKNVILFDVQLKSTVNNLTLLTFELARFKGIYKQNENGEWKLAESETSVPMDLYEKFNKH